MRARIVLGGVAMALCGSVLAAQQQFQILATVLDASGAPAADLQPADVRVLEDDKEGKVSRVEAVERRPSVQIPLDNLAYTVEAYLMANGARLDFETRLLLAGVRDCAVFGIPDEDFGESLAAAVELMPGAQLGAEEIRDYLRARIAKYKVPRRIDFHDSLPREDSGKIFKRRLRDPYWSGAGRRI